MGKKEKIKQFWDLIFSVSGIVAIVYWYSIVGLPSLFPPSIIQIIITLILTPLALMLVIFSIIRHKDDLKKFHEYPRKAIEYSFNSDKSRSDVLFYSYCYLLSFVIIFFLLSIPLEESIKSLPFVGENLGILLQEVIEQVTKLFNGLFTSGGLNLSFDQEFTPKLLVLSFLVSSGTIYMLILKMMRLRIQKITRTELQKKVNKEYPGTGSLVTFLYIVLASLLQKSYFDPDGFFSIWGNWVFLVMLLNLLPFLTILIFFDRIEERI